MQLRVTLATLLFSSFQASAQTGEGVLARCGASSGHAYFLKHPALNPDGPSWEKDGMAEGKIILVRLGQEWDIQFDDSLGAYGYRQDGAEVVKLMETDGLLTVGAFQPNYADLYTFDFLNREVVWTTNRQGVLAPKAGVFRATCE